MLPSLLERDGWRGSALAESCASDAIMLPESFVRNCLASCPTRRLPPRRPGCGRPAASHATGDGCRLIPVRPDQGRRNGVKKKTDKSKSRMWRKWLFKPPKPAAVQQKPIFSFGIYCVAQAGRMYMRQTQKNAARSTFHAPTKERFACGRTGCTTTAIHATAMTKYLQRQV